MFPITQLLQNRIRHRFRKYQTPDLQLIVKDTIGCNVQAASINSRSKVFPLEYEWDGPNGFSSTDPSIVVTSGGKYTLTITDEYNCKTIDSIEVFERIDNPKISIRSNPINCQTDTADLIGSSSVPGSSFEWTGPNQFYIKADSFQTIDSGWFILNVVTPSGCIKTDSVLISKDLNKPQFQYTSDTITCKNDSALVSVNANINPASFGWHSAQNFTIKDTFTISTPNPGIYTFYAVGTNGCSDSINITVPVDTIHPVISPINDTLNCIKTEVRLISGNTDPNTDISWQDPAGMDIFQDSLDVSIPGMYRVRAISENGCQRIQDIFIGIDTLHPLLTVRNDTLNCNKQKIKLQLTDVSSSRYFWTGPGSFIDTTQQPEIQIPGIYQVLASLANGCMSTAQILIEIDTIKPIINYSSDTLNCKKDSVQLLASADKTDAAFLWTGPNGFQTIQKNPYTSLSGNYKLHVTNINGCSDSISLTIYQDIRKPEIYLEPDTLNCLKRNALLHGKTNRDSLLYTWSGPNGLNSTDSILSINTGGAYRLQVESLEGCKSEVTILVFEDTAKALLQIDPDTLNCLITEWTASLQSSLTPADISWSGPNGFTSKMLNPKISNGGNYTVQLTTPNQCISMLTFNILQDTLRPAIQYTGDSITCSHPDAILTANTTPSNLLGIWTGPLGQNQPGNSFQTKLGGNYNFQVTGSNFCTNQIATFVKVDTLAPDLNLSGDTITCLQPRVPLVAKSLTPGISLNWNGPSNFMSTLDSLQILIPGLYTASITAPNGCKSVQNILIPIDTIHPVVVLSADSINCKRIEANLSAQVNPAFTNYRWTDLNNITLSNQLIYKTNKGGVFQFIATNPKNGCQTLKLQTVFEDSLIIRDVLLAQDHPVCGNSFGSMNIAKVIGGHEGLLFAINDPNLFSSQSLFTSLPAGVYTLYIKDSADCRFEKSFEILQIPIVDANIQPEISLRLGKGGTLDLNITSDPNLVKNIDWTPKTFLSCTNCEDPIATPPGDLEYEVTVTDTNGCTITKRILVKIETPKVWAPNVFSPNGDQINDWFYLISSDPDITAINILEIFDRWGNKVFVSAQQKPNNAITGWNGTAKNEKCLPGVYVYWAEVELINGTKWILKGDITLLK
ncbi:MAG: gliding motility-associated C-terminal domain-containing protein [Saprospiraceae bacterium]|nr:gliding motility-associated C-terminal domain-containing protein [Saprospiraceae bacterium]